MHLLQTTPIYPRLCGFAKHVTGRSIGKSAWLIVDLVVGMEPRINQAMP